MEDNGDSDAPKHNGSDASQTPANIKPYNPASPFRGFRHFLTLGLEQGNEIPTLEEQMDIVGHQERSVSPPSRTGLFVHQLQRFSPLLILLTIGGSVYLTGMSSSAFEAPPGTSTSTRHTVGCLFYLFNGQGRQFFYGFVVFQSGNVFTWYSICSISGFSTGCLFLVEVFLVSFPLSFTLNAACCTLCHTCIVCHRTL
ncbi:hypothetical protein ABKV19_002622 [Rosa sericea]